MPADDQKIVHAWELLEKSEHIGLALPQETNLDCLASAEAFMRALAAKGKNTGFLIVPPIARSDIIGDSPLFPHVRPWPMLAKELIISIDGSEAPVSEIRYEKELADVRVILTPKKSAITPDAVSFREGKITCQAILLLGAQSLDPLADALIAPYDSFADIPLITVGASKENSLPHATPHAPALSPSLSEATYLYLQALPPPAMLSAESATLLLAGIIQHTQRFHNAHTSPDAHTVAAALLRAGADRAAALSLANPAEPLSLLQLYGRASIRSKIEQSGMQTLLWSFLTDEDFSRTSRTHADIMHVLSYLASSFPPHQTRVLLWQNPVTKVIQVSIESSSPLSARIQEHITPETGKYAPTITPTFSTFQEAEQYVRHLLNESPSSHPPAPAHPG